MLKELRTLVPDPTQLGQLPVFMAHLGAAVKLQRTYYPVFAMFRPVRLPKDLYGHVWRGARVSSISELRLYLVRGCQGLQQGRGGGVYMRPGTLHQLTQTHEAYTPMRLLVQLTTGGSGSGCRRGKAIVSAHITSMGCRRICPESTYTIDQCYHACLVLCAKQTQVTYSRACCPCLTCCPCLHRWPIGVFAHRRSPAAWSCSRSWCKPYPGWTGRVAPGMLRWPR
jgi:hypothetical protein